MNIGLYCDATYNLTSKEWILSSVGTTAVKYDSVQKKFEHSYCPLMFVLSTLENESLYEILIRNTIKWINKYGNVTIWSGCSDHSWMIRNAFKKCVPSINICECYPHAIRGASKWKYRSKDSKELVKKYIKWMHLSPSKRIFNIFGEKLLEELKVRNEDVALQNMKSTYLHPSWQCFWFAASGNPGDMSNQNLLESFHDKIKDHHLESRQTT